MNERKPGPGAGQSVVGRVGLEPTTTGLKVRGEASATGATSAEARQEAPQATAPDDDKRHKRHKDHPDVTLAAQLVALEEQLRVANVRAEHDRERIAEYTADRDALVAALAGRLAQPIVEPALREQLGAMTAEVRDVAAVLARFVAQVEGGIDKPTHKQWGNGGRDVHLESCFVTAKADAYRVLGRAGWCDIVYDDGERDIGVRWKHDPFDGPDLSDVLRRRLEPPAAAPAPVDSEGGGA